MSTVTATETLTAATNPLTASATTQVVADSYETVDDLVGHFHVDADRIVLRPAPFTATEADLLELNATHDRIAELVDGTLIWKAEMAKFESRVATLLMKFLLVFLDQTRIGHAFDALGLDRMSKGNRRAPDLSVVLRETLLKVYPDGKMTTDPKVFPFSSELCVEVLSESNRAAEITQKRTEFFASGCRLMWVVDPRKATVEVWTGVEKPEAVLTRNDTLTGGTVLPGFELSIDQWFSDAETI